MAVDWGARTARLLPEGKQYSCVPWYRVRKGPSDNEYKVSLPLESTLLPSESTNTAICRWCRIAPLPIRSVHTWCKIASVSVQNL